MNRRLALLPCAAAILGTAVMALSCGTGGDVAGGTGAGNPGVTVSVSFYADTGISGISLAKSLTGMELAKRELPIEDLGNTKFTITGASFTTQRVTFTTDPAADCAALSGTLSDQLRCDNGAITAERPMLFDALEGTAAGLPPLPPAVYTGVVFTMDSAAALHLTGTFIFEDTLRSFTIDLPLAGEVMYRLPGHSVTLDDGDSALFVVSLNADKWLNDIDLGECVENGGIPLDAGGNLVIDGTVPPGACEAIPAMMLDNFISSGTLSITAKKAD